MGAHSDIHSGAKFWTRVDARETDRIFQSRAPGFVQLFVARCLKQGVLRRLQSDTAARTRRVLDAGCGLGDWAFTLAQQGDDVMGFDVSPALVEHGNERARRAGLSNLAFRIGSLPGIRQVTGDRAFDLILIASVLEYLEDDDVRQALDEARFTLSPGGALYVRASVSNRHYEQRLHGELWAAYRTAHRYERFFGQSGYRLLGSWRSERLVLEGLAAQLPGSAAATGLALAPFLARVLGAAQQIDPVGFQSWILEPTG